MIRTYGVLDGGSDGDGPVKASIGPAPLPTERPGSTMITSVRASGLNEGIGGVGGEAALSTPWSPSARSVEAGFGLMRLEHRLVCRLQTSRLEKRVWQ